MFLKWGGEMRQGPRQWQEGGLRLPLGSWVPRLCQAALQRFHAGKEERQLIASLSTRGGDVLVFRRIFVKFLKSVVFSQF